MGKAVDYLRNAKTSDITIKLNKYHKFFGSHSWQLEISYDNKFLVEINTTFDTKADAIKVAKNYLQGLEKRTAHVKKLINNLK